MFQDDEDAQLNKESWSVVKTLRCKQTFLKDWLKIEMPSENKLFNLAVTPLDFIL